MELLINKNEPEVLIKSEPDIENIDFDKSLGAAGENVVIPENPSSNSCIIGEKGEVIKSFIKTEQEDIVMDIVDTKAEKVRVLVYGIDVVQFQEKFAFLKTSFATQHSFATSNCTLQLLFAG